MGYQKDAWLWWNPFIPFCNRHCSSVFHRSPWRNRRIHFCHCCHLCMCCMYSLTNQTIFFFPIFLWSSTSTLVAWLFAIVTDFCSLILPCCKPISKFSIVAMNFPWSASIYSMIEDIRDLGLISFNHNCTLLLTCHCHCCRRPLNL